LKAEKDETARERQDLRDIGIRRESKGAGVKAMGVTSMTKGLLHVRPDKAICASPLAQLEVAHHHVGRVHLGMLNIGLSVERHVVPRPEVVFA